MQSPIRKRSIVVNGHRTSISLEDAFFSGLKEISKQRRLTLAELIAEVDRTRTQDNLSSALRLLVLDYYRSRATAAFSDAHDQRLQRTTGLVDVG